MFATSHLPRDDQLERPGPHQPIWPDFCPGKNRVLRHGNSHWLPDDRHEQVSNQRGNAKRITHCYREKNTKHFVSSKRTHCIPPPRISVEMKSDGARLQKEITYLDIFLLSKLNLNRLNFILNFKRDRLFLTRPSAVLAQRKHRAQRNRQREDFVRAREMSFVAFQNKFRAEFLLEHPAILG